MYCKVHVNAEACMVSLSGKTKRLPRIKTGPLSAHAWHPLRQKNMRPQMHSVHSIARSTMSPHGGQVTRILWGVHSLYKWEGLILSITGIHPSQAPPLLFTDKSRKDPPKLHNLRPEEAYLHLPEGGGIRLHAPRISQT